MRAISDRNRLKIWPRNLQLRLTSCGIIPSELRQRDTLGRRVCAMDDASVHSVPFLAVPRKHASGSGSHAQRGGAHRSQFHHFGLIIVSSLLSWLPNPLRYIETFRRNCLRSQENLQVVWAAPGTLRGAITQLHAPSQRSETAANSLSFRTTCPSILLASSGSVVPKLRERLPPHCCLLPSQMGFPYYPLSVRRSHCFRVDFPPTAVLLGCMVCV